jgi:FeS assembly SUF system regulator
MIRITRQTDYGIVLLISFASAPGEAIRNARDLADQVHLPVPMVSKILKALARGGILASRRGATGGYALARAPHEVTLAQILVALEGPIAMTACIEHEGEGACSLESTCPSRSHWHRINEVVRRAIEDVTLNELAHPFRLRTAAAGLGDAGVPQGGVR